MVNISNDSNGHSRNSSYASESHERCMRGIKGHIGKLGKLKNVALSCSGEEYFDRMLDAMRMLCIIIGYLSEDADMNVLEYISAVTLVASECESFALFMSKNLKNHPEIDWFRVASSAELALPRSYLMLTAGKVYLSKHLDQKHPTMSKVEIIESIRNNSLSISDPVRGIAHRHGMLEILWPNIKDILSTEDAVGLLMDEFTILNRLWVRLGFQSKDSEIYTYRLGLKEIIAKPILLIAHLLNDDLEIYKKSVVTTLLSHIVGCRDDLAQEFLMETILQAFPIRFHTETLHLLLDSISKLNLTIDAKKMIHNIINSILDPSAYGVDAASVFDTLWEKVACVLIERLENWRSNEIILVCICLLQHALSLDPFCAERVNIILVFLHKCWQRQDVYDSPSHSGNVVISQIIGIVIHEIPIGSQLLQIHTLLPLLKELSHITASTLAYEFIERLSKDNDAAFMIKDLDVIFPDILFFAMQEIPEDDFQRERLLSRIKTARDIAEMLFSSILKMVTEDVVGYTMKLSLHILSLNCIIPHVILIPKAINTLLFRKASAESIRNLMNTWRGACQKGIYTYNISLVEYRSIQDTSQMEEMSIYLKDSQYLCLLRTFRQCLEHWAEDADICYSTIVDCIMILEEDVADNFAQSIAIEVIVDIIQKGSENMAKVDISVIIEKLYAHTRRILRKDDRIKSQLLLLQVITFLGSKVELAVVAKLSTGLSSLLSNDNALLDQSVEFCQLLVNYMLTTGADCDLGNLVYPHLQNLNEKVISDEGSHFKGQISQINDGWSKLEIVLRPLYEVESAVPFVMESLSVAETKETKKEDKGKFKEEPEIAENVEITTPFETFNPEMYDF